MKQIPFYQGIKKKVIVSGPSIHEGQWYKCVVYSSLTDSTHTITTVAKGIKAPRPADVPSCVPDLITVTFDFNIFQTKRLALGDNNLAVYDIHDDDDTTPDTERSMYKVYEARVLAADSYVNHIPYSDIVWEDTIPYEEGYLKGGYFDDGYFVLGKNDEVIYNEDQDGYVIKLASTIPAEPES